MNSWPKSLLLTFFLMLAGLVPIETQAEELKSAIDKKVTVRLWSGKEYADAMLVRIDRDKKTDLPKKIRLSLSGGKKKALDFDKVQTIELAGKSLYEAPEEGGKKYRSRRQSRADRLAAEQAAKRKRWLAQAEARGVKPWPELTEEEHQQALYLQKQRYEEARKLFPQLQMVETEHFLFCTNLTVQEVGAYVAALDRMYIWMQQAYGVDPEKSVWRGKASIYAFRTEDEFNAFEQHFYKYRPQPGTAGLCHSNPQRDIVISAKRGSNYDFFGLLLVHETSHGFIHCYETPVRVPSWVNEGMAEVIASMMVPKSNSVQRKEESFVRSMGKTPQPRLGEAFFATDANIPFDRYGGASSMTRFLLEIEQAKYVEFIRLLKTGMPWEEALDKSYGASKQQLVASYGRRIGIPILQP